MGSTPLEERETRERVNEVIWIMILYRTITSTSHAILSASPHVDSIPHHRRPIFDNKLLEAREKNKYMNYF